MEALIITIALYLILWVLGWIFVDEYGNLNSHLSFILKWYDGWVGFFWDSKRQWLYIFPVPFFGIVIKRFRNNLDPLD